MLKSPLALSGTLALALSVSGCAWLTPEPAPVRPPRVDPPAMASEPCQIPELPGDELTNADLESALYASWEVIVVCDLRRRLALEAHAQERQAVADWIEQ